MSVEIKIDYDSCTSCKECLKACSYGVLEWLDDILAVVNASGCAACMECEKNCPVNAISVKER